MVCFPGIAILALGAVCVSAVSLTGLTGCTINGHGILSDVDYFANTHDTGRALRFSAWGLHLSTYAIDRGLSLGYVEKSYFFAGNNSYGKQKGEKAVNPSKMDRSEAELKPVPTETGRAWTLKVPQAAAMSEVGVSLHTNAVSAGFSVGLRRAHALVLPAGGGKFVLLRSHSNHWHFLYQEYSSCVD